MLEPPLGPFIMTPLCSTLLLRLGPNFCTQLLWTRAECSCVGYDVDGCCCCCCHLRGSFSMRRKHLLQMKQMKTHQILVMWDIFSHSSVPGCASFCLSSVASPVACEVSFVAGAYGHSDCASGTSSTWLRGYGSWRRHVPPGTGGERK